MTDRLAAFAKQVGFTVQAEPEEVRAVGVPCLLVDRLISTCTIAKSCDPPNGTPNERLGSARHAVRVTIDCECDGRVYHADGQPIGNHVGGDGSTWSDISIRKGAEHSAEDDVSARDLIHRYAKQIVGAVSAMDCGALECLTADGPFKIPYTHEARSGIAKVQDRIRSMRVAIIGLGGTGSCVLDVIAKTPVAEIHLLDGDVLEWHNYMRAPGAPTSEEIAAQRSEAPAKVDYHRSKYEHLRDGIYAHRISPESQSEFAELLAANSIDFAFVCIDQLPDSDSPRQDHIYGALSDAGVPFVDSGVSITLEDDTIQGAITTSFYPAGSQTLAGRDSKRQGCGRPSRIPKRAASRSQCLGGFIRGHGVAPSHRAVRPSVHPIPAQVPPRSPAHSPSGLSH